MSYKDRSTGLMVFGILTILLGCLSGLFVPLMLFGQAMAAKSTGAPATTSALMPAMILYGSMAVALVWLGIGSIMARRWARALLVLFSWGWLFMGVFGILGVIFFIPGMRAAMAANAPAGQPAPPAAATGIIMGIMFVIFGLFFIGLPGLWAFFYGSRHVKATCEARDPVTRWTDACPLPVLGICLWLAISAPTMLVMPFAVHGVTPFFGTFLNGFPGTLYYLVMAALWAYSAWSIYKLEQRGWWLILIALSAFLISTLLTYARHDITEMYQLMGYPEAQIEQMRKTGLLVGNRMSWLMVICFVPFLGYLLYIKRYLRRGREE